MIASLIVLQTTLVLGELCLADILFTKHLPTRNTFKLRVCVVAAVLIGIVAVSALLIVPQSEKQLWPLLYGGPGLDWRLLGNFCALYFASVAAIYWCYDVSPWVALFCGACAYTTQNIASALEYLIYLLAYVAGIDIFGSYIRLVVSLACCAAIYYLVYKTLIVRIYEHGLQRINDPAVMVLFIFAVLGVLVFDVAIKSIPIFIGQHVLIIVFRTVHFVTCALVLYSMFEMLYNKQLQIETATARQLALERQHQYELSRETIEAINIKVHDIRHLVRNAAQENSTIDQRFMNDLAREIAIYDSRVETGNTVLDTILTEKRLACEVQGITMSCIADGHALDFMETTDLYAFFGNALENAIHASMQLANPSDRKISLVVRRRGALVSIHIENACRETPQFVDGLPQTTQRDKTHHGFGSRSMKRIVEHYGGTLSMSCTQGVFHVDALLTANA